ncbi:hypothetical protein HRbin36_01865 [bacterium HR36]|nr:hypothetical protein HRbin36_01865 [bacterium HR36]
MIVLLFLAVHHRPAIFLVILTIHRLLGTILHCIVPITGRQIGMMGIDLATTQPFIRFVACIFLGDTISLGFAVRRTGHVEAGLLRFRLSKNGQRQARFLLSVLSIQVALFPIKPLYGLVRLGLAGHRPDAYLAAIGPFALLIDPTEDTIRWGELRNRRCRPQGRVE